MSTNPDAIMTWTEDSHLEWSDFVADPNPAVFEDSHSTIRYDRSWTVDSEKEMDGRLVFFISNIQILAQFIPHLSWIRTSMASDLLLRHEQGHFDLAELVRRENKQILQDKFRDRRFPTRGDNDEQIKQFAKEDSGAMVSEQVQHLEQILDQRRREYDEITNFGQDAQKQSEYDLMLDECLGR